MTNTAENIMTLERYSVSIISDDGSFRKRVERLFQSRPTIDLKFLEHGFSDAENPLSGELFSSDVVIFDADPDNTAELDALSAILGNRIGETVFLGLSDADMSIAKARKLRDIGVDDVLPLSITSDELASVIRSSLSVRRRNFVLSKPQEPSGEGVVIPVVQARGGIGATTVAVNLACKLAGTKNMFAAGKKHRVALIDLDIQYGNAAVFFDLEDNGGFQKMVEEEAIPDTQYTRAMLQNHPSGVDVLSAPLPILPLTEVSSDSIAALIKCLKAEYEFVVVDLPRALVEWLAPVIENSNRLQIVMDQSIPAIRQTKRLIDFYREIQIGLPIDLVLNREARSLIKFGQGKDAEDVLKLPFAYWLPDDPKIARKAADIGKPLVLEYPRSPLSRAFGKYANKLAETETQLAVKKQ